MHLLGGFQTNNQMITATAIQRLAVVGSELITQNQNARNKPVTYNRAWWT
jgi:hypothetical protein